MTLLLGPEGKDMVDFLPNNLREKQVPISHHSSQELTDRVLLGNPIAKFYYIRLLKAYTIPWRQRIIPASR